MRGRSHVNASGDTSSGRRPRSKSRGEKEEREQQQELVGLQLKSQRLASLLRPLPRPAGVLVSAMNVTKMNKESAQREVEMRRVERHLMR